jgi:hypothetical protein
MDSSASSRRMGLRVAHVAILALVALLIAALDIRLIHARGLQSEIAQSIALADDIMREGAWPRSAFYPPMVTLVALAVRVAGIARVDPYILNLTFLVLSLVPAYGIGIAVCSKEWQAFSAAALMILNPYFIWTILLSRDSGLEFLFMGIVLWSCLAIVRPVSPDKPSRGRWLALLMVASMVAASLTRVTAFFMAAAVVGLALVLSPSGASRRQMVCCAAALLVFGGLWAYYNFRQVGAFLLATNSGYNLYLGNHPAFLHGYPHYDLDVFLRSQDIAGLDGASEVVRNRRYTQEAIRFIQADPVGFIYRTTMKSIWFWLSPEKLPNYTTDSRIVSQGSLTDWTAHLTPVDVVPGLAYMVFRMVYLPGLLASVVAVYRKTLDRRYALLYGPLLGLWPILALTFPDTRFKLSAEALTLPIVVAAACALWRTRRSIRPEGDRAVPCPAKQVKQG